MSTFLCYEATADLPTGECSVATRVGDEKGRRISARVGIVPVRTPRDRRSWPCPITLRLSAELLRPHCLCPVCVQVLRGGLGMLEAMTEMVSNAKVYHLGIYRDKASLLPVEYYNKLPKRVDCDTVFVLDPCPISGSTAIAAMDILKAWGASKDAAADKHPRRSLQIKFVCICASEEAIENISSAHPDVRPGTLHAPAALRAASWTRAHSTRMASPTPARNPVTPAYRRAWRRSRFMWGSSTACAMPRASHSHPFSRASVTSATGSSALTAPLTPTIPIWRTPEPPGASSPSSPSRWLTAWLATHNRRATVLRATAETTESGAHVCTCGAREGGLGVGQPPPCIAMMRSIPPASNAEYVQTIALGRFVA